MVTEAGLVKVLDFGLAKLVEWPQVKEAEPTDLLQLQTKEGMILGTASYMSPEQAGGRPVDARSDIFSFGSVLYEIVTGQRAFQGDSRMSTVAAVLNRDPKPASEISRPIPRELERIIARCLRKEAGRRFQHMDDLKVALEELKEELDSSPSRAVEGAGPSRKQQGLSGATWVALTVTMAPGVAAWFWFGRSEKVPPEGPLTAVPLTAYPGWELSPSFSPDGKQVPFAQAERKRPV